MITMEAPEQSSATTVGGWAQVETLATDATWTSWVRAGEAGSADVMLQAAQQKISRLTRLKRGWDGGAGRPTSSLAAMVLNGILIHVTSTAGPTPQIAPLPDGGVQVEWLVSGNSVEINVDGRGEVTVLSSDDSGTPVFEAEHWYNERQLVGLLNAVRDHLENLGALVRTRASVI